jgi:uncharacterized protein YdhG (YjbR/CyaY superfamily)
MTDKLGFSDFEKEAMKQRAEELRREHGKKNGEADLLEKVAEMTADERDIAMNLHMLVQRVAPDLTAKTWYGMPAYANQDKKVVLFFQAGSKYESRLSTIGFQDAAQLDDGIFWPTSFAITQWTKDVEDQMRILIQHAVTGQAK